MPVQTALELKAILFQAYDGFADKRIKNLERDEPFIVDDRNRGDYDARNQLFLWFCSMFVTVEAADRVSLTLRGGVPTSDAVNVWIEANAVVDNHGVTLTIDPATLNRLTELADLFSAIIRRRYDVKAYKYVVPRTADSLARLHGVLTGAWS